MTKRNKPTPVSGEEFEQTLARKREITGFAAFNDEERLFLRLCFVTGQPATVYIGKAVVDALVLHLKSIDTGDRTTFATPGRNKAYGVAPRATTQNGK